MSANNTIETTPITGFGTSQKPGESAQLSTVFEIPQSRYGTDHGVNGMSGSNRAPTAGGSHEGSPGSSVGQIFNEKLRDQSPRRALYRESTSRSQGRRPSTRDEAVSRQNGYNRNSMAGSIKPSLPKKRKKSGLGTVIRRIFGKRSVKNRISLPAPTENPYNVRLPSYI